MKIYILYRCNNRAKTSSVNDKLSTALTYTTSDCHFSMNFFFYLFGEIKPSPFRKLLCLFSALIPSLIQDEQRQNKHNKRYQTFLLCFC